jgi:hypothetical protein
VVQRSNIVAEHRYEIHRFQLAGSPVKCQKPMLLSALVASTGLDASGHMEPLACIGEMATALMVTDATAHMASIAAIMAAFASTANCESKRRQGACWTAHCSF